jgi:hypothetical protein
MKYLLLVGIMGLRIFNSFPMEDIKRIKISKYGRIKRDTPQVIGRALKVIGKEMVYYFIEHRKKN